MKKLFSTRNIVLFGLTLTTAVVAQKVSQSFNLSLNGKNSNEKAIVVNNKTYYPEAALKTLGVQVTRNGASIALSNKSVAGGANQTAALEGCVGQTLFNGALRVTLHSFEALQKDGADAGWVADVEFRNGTNTTNNLYSFGMDGGSSWYIAYDDASTYPHYTGYELKGEKNIPPGSSYRLKLNFWPETSNDNSLSFDPKRKPVKLLLLFRKSGASNDTEKLLLADPSFRFKLDCKK